MRVGAGLPHIVVPRYEVTLLLPAILDTESPHITVVAPGWLGGVLLDPLTGCVLTAVAFQR